jgi:hypothetical protein
LLHGTGQASLTRQSQHENHHPHHSGRHRPEQAARPDMNEFASHYALFLAEAVTLVLAVIAPAK